MALRMREAGTQTSDNEDSDYELSAMEKDIIKLTGASPYHPKKRNRMHPLDNTSNVLTEKTI